MERDTAAPTWLFTSHGPRWLESGSTAVAALRGRLTRCGAIQGERVAVVVDDADIHEFDGERWRLRASDPSHRVNHLRYTPDGRLLAATSHARLAEVTDSRLRFNRSFDALAGRDRWYTPWQGPPDAHSLCVTDGVWLAAIHVGWIVRSLDAGETWSPQTEGLHMDVHQLATHPDRPGLVLAATAAGVFVSRDHGEVWRRTGYDWPLSYCRAVAIVTTPEAEVWLASGHSGPGRGALLALYRSVDGGASWAEVEGIPRRGVDHLNHIHRLPDGRLLALARRHAWLSESDGARWHLITAPQWTSSPKRHFVVPALTGAILERASE